MARLVTKFKYLKPNRKQSKGGYAKYIATREGVEKIDESFRLSPATVNQVKLIQKLVKDFPDTKEMHEYRDYLAKPNAGNATDFISRAIEDNIHAATGRKTYADYIATRPRAERMGTHGLFTDDGVEIKLDAVSEELDRYNGNVWTVILSLRREDAERLGFGEGKRWRELLRSEAPEIAENFKIPMENLQWYAAFHNESHHPHVHLIVYSKLENEGYLTARGVQNLRSVFARDIFAQDLVSVYEKQTEYRDELKRESGERIAELLRQIEEGGCDNPALEEKLLQLAGRLSKTKGKKVYGYLKADVKALVRSIVDELEKDERIAELYTLWYERREDVIRTYTETLPPRVPLSENDAFKSVRNAVIQAAMGIVCSTMSGIEVAKDDISAEPTYTEVEKKYRADYKTTWELYSWAKDLLDYDNENYSPHKAAWLLEACAKRGNTVAKYRLGKMCLEGDAIEKDPTAAIRWLTKAAEENNEYAEYLLGKTYLKGEDIEQDIVKAEEYLRRSAGRGNKYVAYTLGKALLDGDVLPQNIPEAVRYLKQAAENDFMPARYVLGKLYYKGEVVEQDLKESLRYLETAAKENPNAAYLAGKICIAEAERNIEKALRYFQIAAADGNSYAEYQLGKLYLFETEIRDETQAVWWLKLSAEHGNVYAQKLLQHMSDERRFYVAANSVWLLGHIAKILQSNIEGEYGGLSRIDKKQRREIMRKKQAQGLKQE